MQGFPSHHISPKPLSALVIYTTIMFLLIDLSPELRHSASLFIRALQTQNNERHADGSLLKDTIGMRSGMAGWPVIASQVAPKERWEVRVGGDWRNSFKVREGVEVEGSTEKSRRPRVPSWVPGSPMRPKEERIMLNT